LAPNPFLQSGLLDRSVSESPSRFGAISMTCGAISESLPAFEAVSPVSCRLSEVRTGLIGISEKQYQTPIGLGKKLSISS
jgi:hypothetical protein